jgi:hypothetical protein
MSNYDTTTAVAICIEDFGTPVLAQTTLPFDEKTATYP